MSDFVARHHREPPGRVVIALTAAEEEYRTALAKAFGEVMDLIKKQDVKGADEYLAEVHRVVGHRAHETLLTMIAEAVGSPKWVYFG